MTTETQTKINDFMAAFFRSNSEHGSELLDLWNSPENQKSLGKCVTKAVATKARVKKDPDHPKRSMSAYLFFCTAQRESVKASLSEDAKATDVTTALGEAWNLLKVSTKEEDIAALKEYQAQAEEDKVRYVGQMDTYAPPTEGAGTSTEKRKGKKDPGAPKGAKTAYLCFCAEEREEVKAGLGEDAKGPDVMVALGVRWNELKVSTEEEDVAKLQKYMAAAEADKERFLKEKAAYTGGRANRMRTNRRKKRGRRQVRHQRWRRVRASSRAPQRCPLTRRCNGTKTPSRATPSRATPSRATPSRATPSRATLTSPPRSLPVSTGWP